MFTALLVFDPILKNVEIVLTLFIFIWIFGWAKSNLGSAKLAVLFALIVVFLTFYTFPILIWLLVLLFFMATFGVEVFDKVRIWKE